MDTIEQPEVLAIMQRAAKQEESHVRFGEERTMELVQHDPALRRRLLGANLVWMWGVQRLAGYVDRKLPKDHPVLSQLQPFLAHALRCAELRLQRMGLCDEPLSQLSLPRKSALLAELAGTKLVHGVRPKRKRLTDTYLDDPSLRARTGGD
jgi:hypothetical protein